MYFEVTYKSTEHSKSLTVITYADYAAEAISNVMDDYPDVDKIISCKIVR